MAGGRIASSGAVITGGARGLGLEVARVLASRGHAVHITDLDGEAAQRAASELGDGAFASALDVRDEEACSAIAAETVSRTGSLGVWVNNAGVLITGPAWEQEAETRRLMIEVNALGTINGTLAALDQMRGAGAGHIVNVISLAGLVAAPGEAVYGSSKHAAIGFSLGTLADLRVAGIRNIDISCICPDGIWTPMLHDKLDDPGAAASFTGVLLMPGQVAERVGWLLEHPRPVLVVPRWRGPMIRAFDRWPRLAMRGAGTVIGFGRLQQRLFARRVKRGSWPPRS